MGCAVYAARNRFENGLWREPSSLDRVGSSFVVAFAVVVAVPVVGVAVDGAHNWDGGKHRAPTFITLLY